MSIDLWEIAAKLRVQSTQATKALGIPLKYGCRHGIVTLISDNLTGKTSREGNTD